MPKIKYTDINMGEKRLAMVSQANKIISEYQRQGYQLTIRQLYYQFVSRNLIPNTEREYKKLVDMMTDARLCGLVDWGAITDLTRSLYELPHWDSPQEIVESVARQFHVDHWADQPWYVEVWIEKLALINVISPVCRRYDVPYTANKGYTSMSEIWGAAHQRLTPAFKAGKHVRVIYLGDHDPSGLDMTRDIEDRLEMFCGRGRVDVRRIALNYDQVEEHAPPPNPAKTTDSRAGKYIKRFGNESWELDALEPRIIAELVENEIDKLIDAGAWRHSKNVQEQGRQELALVAENWNSVIEGLNND